MREDLRRVALFTSGLAEMTRNRAEELVKSWGQPEKREQAQAMARDLMEWSKHNRKELSAFVRSEIQSQLAGVGVATTRDLERLERRVEALELAARSPSAKRTRSEPAGKTAAGRSKTTRERTSSAGGTEQPPRPAGGKG